LDGDQEAYEISQGTHGDWMLRGAEKNPI
jgi:hypothetical protein